MTVMLGSQFWGDGDVGVPMLGSQLWGDDGDVGVPLSAGSDVGVAVLG